MLKMLLLPVRCCCCCCRPGFFFWKMLSNPLLSFGLSRMIGLRGGFRSLCAGVVGAGGTLYQIGPALGSIGVSLKRGFVFRTLYGLYVLKARCCDADGDQSISSS